MRYFVFILIAISVFSSCTTSEIKPSSSGKPGELVIVMDSLLFKGQAGNIIRDSLLASFPALPQDEPLFRPVIVHPSEFKSILQLHRNILIVETGPLQDDRNYALTFKNNIWSNPQLVMNLRAVDESWLEAAALAFIPAIISKFTVEEKLRLKEGFSKLPELEVNRKLKESIGVNIPLTADYYLAKTEHNYLWLRKETIHMSTGIQIYRLPYTSDSAFSVSSIAALRDSISAKHVPGPTTGSYMTTDHNFPFTASTIEIDSTYAVELRGLWKTEGDFMGGPFLCYLVHDKKKDQLIFIDAFVYAPRFNKREYVKQLEAMIYNLKFY